MRAPQPSSTSSSEPAPELLLETLLPRYVEMQIYEALLEAAASEQSARMVAMRQATDAAEEMITDLTLTYNKARQELITAELLDIVGGKAAAGARSVALPGEGRLTEEGPMATGSVRQIIGTVVGRGVPRGRTARDLQRRRDQDGRRPVADH